MKKLLTFVALTLALICLVVSCGGQTEQNPPEQNQPEQNQPEQDLPTHTHSFGEWEITKNPTCTDNGTKVCYCDCGETQTEVIASFGHTPGDTVIENTINATCTVNGSYDEVVYCSVEECKAQISRTTRLIEASGHLFGEWITIKEATRSEEGVKERSCTCGEKETEIIHAKGSEGLEFTSNGDGTCYVSGIGTCTDTDIIIPKFSPNGDSVTSIGAAAFYRRHSLESVVIPNSVTNIGDEAFYYCESLKNMVIPDSVISIGRSAFASCHGIESIVIGNSVTSIGNAAFYDCYSLKSVVIPASVTSIGDKVFYGSGLESIVIGDGVTSIGDEAFGFCKSLKNAVIPASVTSIGESPFYFCPSLTNIEVDSNNANYKDIDGNLYTKDGKTLLQYATGKSDASFAIPDNVTSIGSHAFIDCSGLTGVVIPYGVTSIGESAFYSCRSLTSIEIPDSVTSIGDSAFVYCTSLESVVISNGVTSIGRMVFDNCYSLKSVVIPDGVTSLGSDAFAHCSSLTSIVIPASVTSIGNGAFQYCSSLTDMKYRGTEKQWKAVSRSSYWDYYTGEYTITYNYDGK